MNFSFTNLSLSGVQAATGGSVLPPGKYVAKVKEVEFVDNKNKNGKVLKVKLVAKEGVITDNINVFHSDSAKAQEIGQEQLKSLLVNGGHPDPDNIGQHGLLSIKGLTVGIYVGSDEYNGKESSKVKGYMKPEAVPVAGQAAQKPDLKSFNDDDIPF